MCDITANACDAYCCCDPDCDQAIRDVWNANYDQVCAKNFIGQVFKPEQRCIDRQAIYAFNKRDGMNVQETDKTFCVELSENSPEFGSQVLIKQSEVPSSPTSLQFDLGAIISGTDSQ